MAAMLTGLHTWLPHNTTLFPLEKQLIMFLFAFCFEFGVLPPRLSMPHITRAPVTSATYRLLQLPGWFGLRSVWMDMCRLRLKAPLLQSPGSSKRGPCSHACMVQVWLGSNIASKEKGYPPAQTWFPVHRPRGNSFAPRLQ
jgi:hypothetical protein